MTAVLRKVVDENDALDLYERCARSQQDLASFCVQEGVSSRSLHTWRYMREEAEALPLAVETGIRLVEMVAPGGAVPLASPRYRVMLGTITIEVDDSFRQDTLARLIATVSGC